MLGNLQKVQDKDKELKAGKEMIAKVLKRENKVICQVTFSIDQSQLLPKKKKVSPKMLQNNNCLKT